VQATAHQASSELAVPHRHGRISNTCPNQKDISGKNRAHSSTNRKRGDKHTRSRKDPGAMACKSGERPQGQRSQHAAQAHPPGNDSITRQKVQEIKPQISKIRATRRGCLAADQEMLDAALAAFHQGVGGRVMHTRQLERGQRPCEGRESQCTV
jgi:hypothetical protein